jgi:type IV pilus assembly protein PilZ
MSQAFSPRVTRRWIGGKGEKVSNDESKRAELPLSERRSAERIDVILAVDCETDDTFLYANITNISELGIFVRTNEPLEIGTRLTLKFQPPGAREPFVLSGQVQWVNQVRVLSDNPNPGMGIRFIDLTRELRQRIIDAVRTIAYVHGASN